SVYAFDIGTPSTPRITTVYYGTWGNLCHAPRASDCQVSDRPEMFVNSGIRGQAVNRLGNLVEAYPLRADAQAVFWAEAVIEKERVEQSVDGQGRVHYFAYGTNQWRRERLTDSTFDVQPVTPGTQSAPTATHIGSGNYATVMTTAGDPRLNTVRANG